MRSACLPPVPPASRLHPDEIREFMQQTVHHFYAPLWPHPPRPLPPALNVDFDPVNKYKSVNPMTVMTHHPLY